MMTNRWDESKDFFLYPLDPIWVVIWLRCFLDSAVFKRRVEQQHEKLQEFSHCQHREPNPQTQLTANVGHEILNLLKAKYNQSQVSSVLNQTIC